jgi:hypothetical protein
MNKMNVAVWIASAFVLIYTVGVHTIFSPLASCVLYLTSPFMLLWMVYSILKYGKIPQQTFAETFYEDYKMGGCRD